MKTNMESKLLTLALTAVLAPSLGRSQSIVRTILGGAPDGVQAISATLNEPSAVVSDGNGNVYVALLGAHQVVKISSGGIASLVAGTGVQDSTGDGGPARLATLNTPMALAVDSAGNLYIADSDANRVRRVGRDGVITTFAGTGEIGSGGDGGPADKAGLIRPSGLAFDPSGNLLIADTGNLVIRMVTPNGTITTFAGNGSRGSDGDDGPALQAQFDYPQGIAVDSTGRVFIADTGNNWIRVVARDGTLTRFAGTNSSGPFGGGADPTVATNAVLASPTSLAVDKSGNLYFVESGADRVRRITPDGKIANFAGTGVGGAAGDGGLARFANLSVKGVAVDPNNNLLIADGANNRVRIVTTVDNVIDTMAGDGKSSYDVQGLALDGDILYFSDGASNRVRRFNLSSGKIDLVAGDGQATFAGDGGKATSASLYGPQGVAVDKSGNLYIADSGNNRVRRVTTDGIISTVAGTGTASSTGDGSSATSATLNEPAALVVDSSGNLFIAERSGHVVRKVAAGGTISTVAGTGTGGSPASLSGTATNQPLDFPDGLALESDGSLLIADTGNNWIRRLTRDGIITTVAGSWNAGSGGDGGPATSAALSGPAGIAVDAWGNLYISDTGNQKIRRVTVDGIISTVAGNGAADYNGDGSPATAYSFNYPSALVTGPGCSVLIADTQNKRLRQLWPAVDYTINSTPRGLQIAVDGQISTAPTAVSLLPGTQHHVDGPSPQGGPVGTRYLISESPEFSVPCGVAHATMTVNFRTQYSLAIAADDGGAVSPAVAWQDAGAGVLLSATPKTGFVFAGWEGDCKGAGACQLFMNSPKSVKADFAPAKIQKGVISSGGVVGAGLSTPPVRALSPNGIAIVFGNGFAPAGTMGVSGPTNLVNGKVSTELDGVCVLVGANSAPVLAVTPNQINFQVPHVPASGALPVQVLTGCGTVSEIRSDPEIVPVQSAAPEFFSFVQPSGGQNPIAAINAATGVYVGSPDLLPGAAFVPAKPGDVLTLYATGFGLTDPPFDAGEFPQKESPIKGDIWVSVASIRLEKADVLYVGVSPSKVGLYQINIRLPDATPDGNQPVVVSVNGFASPEGGYVTVKR